MDDALVSLVGARFSRSIKIDSEGSGSLFFEGRTSGLITLSHRFYEKGDVFQRKIGYHVLCYSEFQADYPNSKFFSVEDARDFIKQVVKESELDGSILAIYQAREFRQSLLSMPSLSLEDLLRGYLKTKESQTSHANTFGLFKRKLFDDPKFRSLLDMPARNVVFTDFEVLINKMKREGIEPSLDLLLDAVSAAYNWGHRYDKAPSFYGLSLNGLFRLPALNPFKSKPRFNKNPNHKKDQFTDRQLWLLWHSAEVFRSQVGNLAQFLIASGGIRPEHAVKLRWSSFNRKSRYPHLVAVNAKTGGKAEEYQYSVVLNPLSFHLLNKMYERTYAATYVFESTRTSGIPMGSLLTYDWKQHFYRWCSDRYNYSMPNVSMGMIRGTCTTRLSIAGVDPATNDLIQAHNLKLSSVKAVHYDNDKQLKQKSDALILWDKYLRELLSKPYDEVRDVYPENQELVEGESPVIMARGL
ncbi:hypothetical protein [Endozoicomonas ascidiicola]|uniref:hypothetical protein n=1 Tax=Endozoicomonas ascidiicola TaxID=1698521 RepID=UPI00082D0C67|nr:hypothetical protein [Endozoicomonas ascidiicola]